MMIYRIFGTPEEDSYREGCWDIDALIKEDESDHDRDAYRAIVTLNSREKALHLLHKLNRVIGPLDLTKELDDFVTEEGNKNDQESDCI